MLLHPVSQFCQLPQAKLPEPTKTQTHRNPEARR